jgi:hypothetical protein
MIEEYGDEVGYFGRVWTNDKGDATLASPNQKLLIETSFNN